MSIWDGSVFLLLLFPILLYSEISTDTLYPKGISFVRTDESISIDSPFNSALNDSVITIEDSTCKIKEKRKFVWPEQILPMTFIVTGISLNAGEVKNNLQDRMPNTSTRFDNFSQYAPMIELYVANIFLREHQNSVWDQTKYLLISQLLYSVITVSTIKNITKVERPNGTKGHYSYPSGHTATAFVGATALHQEYKESAPILAYSGYLFALTTAILRVTNDKHWIPDVVTSAGLAMLITNLVYYFEPFKSSRIKERIKLRDEKKKANLISITPTISFDSENWKLGFVGKF